MNLQESIKEQPQIGNSVISRLNEVCPQMHARLMPAGDSWVVVCDYTPVPIPWGWQQGHTQTTLTSEESEYAAFLIAMGQTHHQKINNVASVNQITMRGKTDVRDCFEVRGVDTGEKLYVIPSSEYEKVRETGVPLKTEKMEHALEQWWSDSRHHAAKDTKLQSLATSSLLGNTYDYLVPVISGLKPIAIDFHKTQLTEAAVASLNGVLLLTDDPEPALINKEAVTRIVSENQDIFKVLGISATTSPQIIVQKVLTSMQHGHDASPQTNKRTASIALGLLLGYDRHSCEEYDRFNPGWAPGKDHPFVGAIPHQINEFPFNIWGVDYGVADSDSNSDFAALKEKYNDLLQVVESLLESGQSPLSVLGKVAAWEELEKSVPAIREGLGLKLRRALKSASTEIKKLGGDGRRNPHSHH